MSLNVTGAVTVLGLANVVTAQSLFAADSVAGWPPALDRSNTFTQSIDGRIIERFTHESRNSWGYPASQKNYFFLVHPRKMGGQAPLCVVLHSANRTALDFLGFYYLNRKVDPNDNPADIREEIPDDCYTLFLDTNNDEWWGSNSALSDRNKYAKEQTPAESRVLDTVEWVTTKYNLDRNRIYLVGLSMGGCGSLGIGLPHGDVFAAIRVRVPAGTAYAACRMGVVAELPADPPLVINLSAQNDPWSKDQDVLLQAACDHRLALIFGWGPFGHVGARSPIARYTGCAAVLAFPWMEIRRNEAYPVFTQAATDQRAPWLHKSGGADESGQINGYFRWKNVADKPAEFAMRLWLDSPVPDTLPTESTANITLRRLQQFNIAAGRSYAWSLQRDETVVASGAVAADAAGLLTIPGVTIKGAPAVLLLKACNGASAVATSRSHS